MHYIFMYMHTGVHIDTNMNIYINTICLLATFSCLLLLYTHTYICIYITYILTLIYHTTYWVWYCLYVHCLRIVHLLLFNKFGAHPLGIQFSFSQQSIVAIALYLAMGPCEYSSFCLSVSMFTPLRSCLGHHYWRIMAADFSFIGDTISQQMLIASVSTSPMFPQR